MALPTTRETFIEYCLRALGSPVLYINVDDEQIEDRVDEALLYYRDYHFDGTQKVYLKHQVTQADITNKYITVPDSITGIVRIFDIGEGLNTSNLFNVRYQIHLNDLFDFSSASFAPYVMSMRHIETLHEIFVGKKPIRFNRHTDKLYIDMDWDADIQVGQFLVIDCYQILDPNTYSDVWSDRWLLRYTTALIKRQWGINLSKFASIQLPGGIQLDGVRILQEATEEINKLEDDMINSYSLPVSDLIG